MKKFFSIFVVIAVILSACNWPGHKSELNNLNDSIATLEKEIYNPAQEKLDRSKAVKLIDLYQKVAQEDPNNPLAPEYLFKAGDISINVQNPNKTIMIFDEILVDYPNYEKAPTVLFLKAFVYDDQLHDYANAKKYYEMYLEKYPNSEFADDAEISLKNLGKTPEELIEEFQKNNP